MITIKMELKKVNYLGVLYINNEFIDNFIKSQFKQ